MPPSAIPIPPQDLLCMNDLANAHAFRVDLAYARADNLLFGQAIYTPQARLWLHRTLAEIVCTAAALCAAEYGARFILYDGLRTLEAQEAMLRTARVRANPHWLQEPRLLSPPGAGGHPRGMAIDIGLEDFGGNLLDMGTAFDFLAENAEPVHNPAHRAHPNLSETAQQNRAILDGSMRRAAQDLGRELLPLPQEWWDFRLPPDVYNAYIPLSENDLPPSIRLL